MGQTVVDYNGNPVVLTDEAESHIREGHPDAAGYLDRLSEVVGDPSIVCFRARTQGTFTTGEV